MTFGNLSLASRGMILAVTYIILMTFIYNTIRSLFLKRSRLNIVASIVATLITNLLLQILDMHHIGLYVIKLELPLPILLVIQILLLLIAVAQQYMIGKWQETHISAMSVKEAFDMLPTGLCYYNDNDGMPLMVNQTMQDISVDLFGKGVTDGKEFCNRLNETETAMAVSEGKAPLVRCSDGRTYSIRQQKLFIKNKEIPEIIAADVSREYALTQELEERRTKAAQLNTRLKALLRTIEYLTMSRELLQLKVALHDNIGQSILIARRYLAEPQSVDRDELLYLWKDNIRHLLNEEQEEWELPYYVISKEADKLGIKLQIVGELPKETKLIPVVDSAISAHIGNTLKHADGKLATIKVKETGGSYILTFLNDGKKPEKEIEEKGGLRNLRHDIESVGGSLKIYTSPEFCMEIILPKED
ncbi:hypothetical protein [Butyrivibrio sp. INlla16]|uniref:hypothetical protein n=1 Tax=Butyrivibrio sp. INlla16 TaxID=1520807 RepID=UPI000884BCC6|nr:hypothetical protein [Butyrivibrio sp. INlla16]SDB41068.1 hypothetical protein SAMN02910263_01978 [Butyrivibrio sp. INlla16]